MSGPELRVVLFEDAAVAGLGPVAALRPAFEIRVGALNLRERLELCSGVLAVAAECRDLAGWGGLLPATATGPTDLRVNARLCGPVEAVEAALHDLGDGERFERDGATFAARGEGLRRREAPRDLELVERPWDYLRINDGLLVRDATTLAERGAVPRRIHGVRFTKESPRQALLGEVSFTKMESSAGATLIGPGAILVGSGAVVRPGAVIDAARGPVILGAGVVVHPLSVVTGPAYLGPGTVVNPGAKLREGTSAGAFCKLGGEVEESVILDLSNKQHDGFLGHALVGSWVNLGADTNGSDLKNNYSTVRVDLGDGPLDSGTRFVGPHLGDHVKTGIDTMLTTGAVVGVAANVFGGGFAPRHVPAFSWGGAGGLVEYRLEDALDTARAVYARRDVEWTHETEELLQRHFAETAAARARHSVG